MEFWHMSGDGDGNFVIYPLGALGFGGLVIVLFAIIKAIVNGSADGIYVFANNNTWIVMLIITVISIAISIFSVWLSDLSGRKRIHMAILFGLCLIFVLSLCYSELIYWIGSFLGQLEEVFIGAILSAPIFLVLMIIQMLITLGLCVVILIAMDSKRNMVSYVVGIAANILVICLFCTSQLPSFIFHS